MQVNRMARRTSNNHGEALPKAVMLTAEEAQRVAAGTAAALPSETGGGGSTTGYVPPAKPERTV